jgi:hypothetical protein
MYYHEISLWSVLPLGKVKKNWNPSYQQPQVVSHLSSDSKYLVYVQIVTLTQSNVLVSGRWLLKIYSIYSMISQ